MTMNVLILTVATTAIMCFAVGARWGSRNVRTAKADSLTGAVSRKEALRHLDSLLSRPRRRGYTVGVAYCDVDSLKKVNDTRGHSAGDRVLVSVATRLRNALRPSDVVARLGGDEFLVICDGVRTTADMDRIALRLRAAVSPVVPLGDATAGALVDGGQDALAVSVSIGTATSTGAISDAEDLISRADQAMYSSKRIRAELPINGGPLPPIRLKVR